MDKNEELKKALATSMEMEESGREFYIGAAKKSTNELGRRVFEALADDEIRHLAAIRAFCEQMAKKGKGPEVCAVMPEHKKIKERLIFGRREEELLKKVEPGADELEAYKTAMEMENEGYEFYRKTMESAEDPNAKKLYEFMLEEEESHYELLSSTYDYLKDPAAWFAKEERPIVEG